MRKCFCGGEIVSNGVQYKGDVLIDDGRIVAVGHNLDLRETDEIIDCTGCIVMPGAIDAHCHIQLDTGIFKTPDDWWIGSQEAARGGITTVIDFVGPEPGEDLKHALDFRLGQSEPSIIDYTYHLTALDAEERTLKSIAQCPEWGISSLKLYTTYRPNYYLDDASILKILETAASVGLTTLIHCENDAIVSCEGMRHADESLWRSYPDRRPGIAEVEAAERMIRLAEYSGARVVIAHNSMAETAEAVAAARSRGVSVFNETTPQYLFLNADCNHHHPEPWRYILQPPLRDASNNAGLQKAVRARKVDMVITDHCAYTKAQKIGAPDATPGGLPGLETLVSLTAAIPGITWPEVARVLCENPAQIYGLWPHKGALLPGFDADILVIRDKTYEIDESKLTTFAGYSPFNGCTARGIISRVFRRGEEIVRDGEVLAQRGSGKFVRIDCRM